MDIRPPLQRLLQRLKQLQRRLPRPPRRTAGTAGGRFQPGALGLTGIAIAAMCVTLVLIQAFGGTFRTAEPGGDGTAPPSASGTPPEGTARIMIAGDSIVQGSTGDYTWRYRLYQHLLDTGADVDFVGPYDEMLDVHSGEFGDTDYADPDFDTDHAGVWGSTAGNVADGIGAHVAEYQPHYLLLMVGANDFANDHTAAEALESLRDAVDAARVADGDMQIVLGEVTPSWGTGRDEFVNGEAMSFNEMLPELAAGLSEGGAPVVVANTAADYAPAEDNWDSTHPNARGELKIAAAFADTLADQLALGERYPRPLPEVLAGPRSAPEVRAEDAGGGEVELSWDPVSGATRYEVLQQRIDPDPDEQVALPAEVAGEGSERRTASAEQLLSGATYEFAVRPYKDRAAGKASEKVRITVDAGPPPAPEGLEVGTEGGRPALTWDKADGAGHYEVLWRPLECAEGQQDCRPADSDGPADGTGWSTAEIVDGTSWPISTTRPAEYAVRAHHDYIQGDYSETVEFIPDS
ncbi:GDSL-type esterase/lipase family protein [Nocardiopsis coralliicola]